MYANKIALAVAPLLLAVARADLQLDNDDVPNACKAICKPIVTLTQACEVDLSGSDDTDRNENRLEAQCICTNDSFDVANIAALCADCMRQSYQNNDSNDDNDDDDDDDDDDNWDYADLEEMRDILSTCGWPTSSYASASSTAADGITVDATAPTALSQLTTTIVPGSTRSGSGSGSGTTATVSVNPTATGSAGSNDAASSTGSDAASSASESAAQASETDNAAAALAPLGVAGFAVAGAFLMLA
ncbi:hypothetical protein B0J13DRAFT_611186 [Dactylonectria estremocensis]|uniref:Protein CAP22 n=1 Tax=Dactylonectria estremocensis TaxID=1079267 RepID=A0A9P9E288_9HYPO|nr:hypothetical protein B0J13DRAFT_611186 [Dactylonectria estremocensis]